MSMNELLILKDISMKIPDSDLTDVCIVAEACLEFSAFSSDLARPSLKAVALTVRRDAEQRSAVQLRRKTGCVASQVAGTKTLVSLLKRHSPIKKSGALFHPQFRFTSR